MRKEQIEISPMGTFFISRKGDKMNKYRKTKQIAILAMFTAIAFATLFVLRISGIGGFLSFDVKDAIIMTAAMLFGPIPGVIISFVVALLEMLTVSGTGPWGLLMNFVSTAVFVAVGSSIYRYVPRLKKTMLGAVSGLVMSVLFATGTMLLLNLVVTPIYFNVPVETVKQMMLPLLLPFNLTKSVLNAAIVLMIYKPLSVALKRAGVVGVETEQPEKFKFDWRTVIVLCVGAAIVVAGVLIMIKGLGGEFNFIKK